MPAGVKVVGRGIATVVMALAGLAVGGAANAAPQECLYAVFFDLGNTLVESGAGGLFHLRVGAQDTVDALQAAGIQIGVITNVAAGWTRADLEALLAEPEFLDEFDVLVLSSQAPASKPNPAIYTFAHGLLPVPLPIGNTAFVGETIGEIANAETNPTLGARSVGMVGIHLSGAVPDSRADFTVPTLLDLIDVVAPGCVFRDDLESGDVGRWSAALP